MGTPRLLVGVNDWLDLSLESEERPGQLLELVAGVIDLVAEYALSHGWKYSTLFRVMPKWVKIPYQKINRRTTYL